MTANLLAHHWSATNVRITLIESSDIGIIGVGEGSTPYLKNFFHLLGISEREWMPACNATYKCAIRFPGWSTQSGYTEYSHPFYAVADRQLGEACFRNANLRRRGTDAPANPQDFFIAAELARQQLAPIAQTTEWPGGDYAYHFDAGLLGQFLKQHAHSLGVDHKLATIVQVQQHPNGDIAQLLLADGNTLTADFFIDCSGFAGLLINQTLGEPFISYKNNLWNDCAVAIPSSLNANDGIPSETVSTGLGYGWAWQIPLANRFGNGYVYCSDFLSKEAAEKELRSHLQAQRGASGLCTHRTTFPFASRVFKTFIRRALAYSPALILFFHHQNIILMLLNAHIEQLFQRKNKSVYIVNIKHTGNFLVF